MPELVILGPWLRRFLCEYIVTERTRPGTPARAIGTPSAFFCPSSAASCASPWTGWPCTISPPGMCCSSLHISRKIAGALPRPAIRGLPPSRAFARFIGSRDPAHVEWCGHIRAIATKKSMPPVVGWADQGRKWKPCSPCPTASTKRGRSEYALLLFLYNTGARVSEATQREVRDLQIGRGNGGHDSATLHGKGGKTRQCPLWPETERVLADEILGRSGDDAVFISRLGTPFTRFGIYRLIERCAARVPELVDRAITPHVIRHTTACHLVLAGVDINTIRAWLGHVSISTTNIYAEIDLTLKANAVALCEVGQPRPARSWKEDKDLMAFLKSL